MRRTDEKRPDCVVLTEFPLWLASAVVVLLVMLLGEVFGSKSDVGTLVEFSVITVLMLLFLRLISGKKTFTYLNHQTGYTIRMLLPTLIFPVLITALGAFGLFSEKPPLAANWPVMLLLSAANMFLVGVYEECCFRACACDAMLPALKRTKHPFLITAVVSGLLFGYVHVVIADFSDLHQTLQFFLKIATMAISGAAYMILYWKTRNLLGIAIVHGLNDFLLDFMTKIFVFEETLIKSGESGCRANFRRIKAQVQESFVDFKLLQRRAGE